MPRHNESVQRPGSGPRDRRVKETCRCRLQDTNTRPYQPVFDVVAIREGNVVREIAVAIVGRCDRPDGGVLIQAVGGVTGAARGRRDVEPAGIGVGLADPLIGGTVSKREGDVAVRRTGLSRHRTEADAGCSVDGVVTNRRRVPRLRFKSTRAIDLPVTTAQGRMPDLPRSLLTVKKYKPPFNRTNLAGRNAYTYLTLRPGQVKGL